MRTSITITLFHLILPVILMGQNAKNMNQNLFTYRSHYSVEETLSRIESQLKPLTEKYNLQDHPIIEKIQKLLEELVTQASDRPSTDEQQPIR